MPSAALRLHGRSLGAHTGRVGAGSLGVASWKLHAVKLLVVAGWILGENAYGAYGARCEGTSLNARLARWGCPCRTSEGGEYAPSREAGACCSSDMASAMRLDAYSWRHWWCSSCDMPQHMRYEATEGRYYYLRPYHYRHIAEHQTWTRAIGVDRRMPYSNEFFQNLAAGHSEESADEETGEPVVGEEEADESKQDE